MFQLQRTGPLAEPEQLFLESPHEPFCIRVPLRVVVTGEGLGDAQGRRARAALAQRGDGIKIGRLLKKSAIAKTVRRETFFVSGFGRLTFYVSPFTDDKDCPFERSASCSCASTIPKITVGFDRQLSFSAVC